MTTQEVEAAAAAANESTALLPSSGEGENEGEEKKQHLYYDEILSSTRTIPHQQYGYCSFGFFMSVLALVSFLVLAVLRVAKGSSDPNMWSSSFLRRQSTADLPHEYTVVEIYQPFGYNDYAITTKNGLEVYYVKYQYHASSSIYGIELSLQDMKGKELAVIKGDSYTWVDYKIERDGKLWAQFSSNPKKHGEKGQSWWDFSHKKKLWMDILDKDSEDGDYKIEAPNFWNWGSSEEYSVERTSTGALAGTITYYWSFSRQDTYNVVVQEGEDDVALLLISVVLDLIYYNNYKKFEDDDDDSS